MMIYLNPVKYLFFVINFIIYLKIFFIICLNFITILFYLKYLIPLIFLFFLFIIINLNYESNFIFKEKKFIFKTLELFFDILIIFQHVHFHFLNVC